MASKFPQDGTTPHEIYSKAERGAARKERIIQADTVHYKVIRKGLEAAVIGGISAGALLYALKKPIYDRKLFLPYRLLFLTMVMTGSFFAKSDLASVSYDRAFSSKYSITREDETDKVASAIAGDNSWMAKNKTQMMFGLWAGFFSAAIIYNFRRKDIDLPQKLINSRLVAQTSVLAGVGFMGAASTLFPAPAVEEENHHY